MQPSGNLLTDPMVPPSQDPSGTIGATGNAIKNYVCEYKREIYAASAIAVLSTSGGAAVPAGLTAVATWYVCEGDPPGGDDIPGIGGFGGQCVAPYRFVCKAQIETISGGIVTGSGTITYTFRGSGPVARIVPDTADQYSGPYSGYGYMSPFRPNGNAGDSIAEGAETSIDVTSKVWRMRGTASWTATRLDGQPDSCGNAPTQYPPLPPVAPTFPVITIYAPVTNNFGITWHMPITIGPITIPVKIGPFALNIGIDGLSIPVDINGNFYLSGTGATGTSTDQEEKQEEEPNPQGDGGSTTTIRLLSRDCQDEVLLDTTQTGPMPAILGPVIQDLNRHNEKRYLAQCEGGEDDAEYATVVVGGINSTVSNQFEDTGILSPDTVAVIVRLNPPNAKITPYRISSSGEIQGKFGIFSWGFLRAGAWYHDEGKMQWYQNGYYTLPERHGADIRCRYTAPIGVSGTIYAVIKIN